MSELDYQLLVEALGGQPVTSAIEAENPYSPFLPISKAATLGAAGLVAKNPSNQNIKEGLAVGAISGLLDGLLGRKSRDFTADRGALASEAIFSGQQPQGMSNALFNVIRSERDKASFSALADRIGRGLDVKQAGQEAAVTELAKRAIDERVITEDGKVAGIERELTHPIMEEQTSIINKLSDEFRKRTANFRAADIGVKAMIKAFKDPEGTSDFELIRRAAQAVEPGLAVRKDDQDSIIGAASVLGQSHQMLQSAIDGKTKLTPKVRAGIMRVGLRGYEQYKMDFERNQQMLERQAQRARIDDRGLYMDILEAEAPEKLWPLYSQPISAQVRAAQAILEGQTSTPDVGVKILSVRDK